MCKFAFRFEFKLENMISYLQIDKLTKSFGDLVLFEDITFGVAQGQKIGLIAKNGTGKTTLLNIIGGKEDYDSGEVVFRKDLRVGYLEQSPSYPEELTVLLRDAEIRLDKLHGADAPQTHQDFRLHQRKRIIRIWRTSLPVWIASRRGIMSRKRNKSSGS